MKEKKKVLDPITFEVLKSSYKAICSRGSAIIENRACSPVITEGHDYSVSILTPDGRLVAHGVKDHGPHLGTLEATVRTALNDIKNFWPGDVYIFNDPHRGGTHTQDVRMIRPIFYNNDIFAFAVGICHLTDIGGPIPGSFNSNATDCFSEGLQLPMMKLYANDIPVKSTFDLIELNVRLPNETRGDLTAQYLAIIEVEKSLLQFVEKYTLDIIEKSFEEIMDSSELLFKQEVKELNDNSYEFVDYVYKDQGHADKPPIKIKCKLTIEGEKVIIDYTDSDPAPVGPTGVTREVLLSAILDGTLHYFPYLNPLNHGIIRSIDLKSKPGTATHVIRPNPVGGFCSGVYEKVDATVMGCWAQVFANINPTRVLAGTANLQNCVISGINPHTGSNYVSYMWLEGGRGARSFKDGPSFTMMTYAGGASNQSVEILENLYPLRYTKVEVVKDSCGHGKFRGGYGLYRNFEMLADGKISVHGDREKITPYGLAGGTNGGANLLLVNEDTSYERNLGMCATNVTLKPGDQITFCSNGGGGIGNPLERELDMVLEDVKNGFLSLEVARDVYGVIIKVIDQEGSLFQIDLKQTEQLRDIKKDEKNKQGYGPGEVNPHGNKISLKINNR